MKGILYIQGLLWIPFFLYYLSCLCLFDVFVQPSCIIKLLKCNMSKRVLIIFPPNFFNFPLQHILPPSPQPELVALCICSGPNPKSHPQFLHPSPPPGPPPSPVPSGCMLNPFASHCPHCHHSCPSHQYPSSELNAIA